MRIPRIYHPDLILLDQPFALSQDATNHLANVLRLKAEHPIVLFNGDGNEYSATLIEVNKRKVLASAHAKLSLSVESPLSIHLGQGVSKGDRMDFALQKSAELGVSEITPLLTERCAVKLDAQRWQKKHQQWQKLIISACEQCGRNSLPELHPPIPLANWLAQGGEQLRLTLDPQATKSIKHLSPPGKGVKLLIGPEGGLSDQELYQSQQSGFSGMSLGPRILRTETAALASISLLQGLFGDL